MTKVILNGAGGAMGHFVVSTIDEQFPEVEIVAGIDPNAKSDSSFPIFKTIDACDVKADAIIDFSRPEALTGLLAYAKKTQTPILLCTTGYSDDQKAELKAASSDVAVFFSANMSLGVNLQMNLIAKAATLLYPNFEVEIIEKHHNKKVDSPSGTALALADSINNAIDNKLEYTYGRHSKTEKRQPNELGIHAVRGGTIVGEHEVMFIGKDEILEINHRALSKQVFAVGAIRAAVFLNGKGKGFYNMQDLVSEMTD